VTPIRGEPSQLVIVSGNEEGGGECCSGSGVVEDGNFLNYSILMFS
jgi:hypothetical protein